MGVKEEQIFIIETVRLAKHNYKRVLTSFAYITFVETHVWTKKKRKTNS